VTYGNSALSNGASFGDSKVYDSSAGGEYTCLLDRVFGVSAFKWQRVR